MRAGQVIALLVYVAVIAGIYWFARALANADVDDE